MPSTRSTSTRVGEFWRNFHKPYWFIAHLNNDDEIKEIVQCYDFGDFADNLVRFSPSMDRGFVRIKTYSNPFVATV